MWKTISKSIVKTKIYNVFTFFIYHNHVFIISLCLMTNCSCFSSSNTFFIKKCHVNTVSNLRSILVFFRVALHDNDGSVTKIEGPKLNLAS